MASRGGRGAASAAAKQPPVSGVNLARASARGGRGGRRPIQTIKLKTLRRPQAQDIISVFNQRTESLDDKKSLAEDFGLIPLLELSGHEHISIKGHGEKMLYDMKQENGEIYCEQFSPIAEVLRYKNMQAQKDGIWALAIFAGLSDKNHAPILLDVGWQAILTRAKSNHPQLKLGAVTLISNLSTTEDSQDIIMNEGGIELLNDLLAKADSLEPPLLRAVLNAFANLVSNDDYRNDIVNKSFLDQMQGFLSHPDEEVVAAAVHFFANISEKEEHRQDLVNRGLIETMLPFLRSENELIVQGATKFFAQMCENSEYAERAINGGLLGYLARLVQRSNNKEILLNVARNVEVLAELGFGDLLKGADLDKLMQRLHELNDDEDIRAAAGQALEALGASAVNNRSAVERENREREAREAREAAERAAERAEKERREREAREALERERAEKVSLAQKKKAPGVDRELLMKMEADALARAKLEQEARQQGLFLGKKINN